MGLEVHFEELRKTVLEIISEKGDLTEDELKVIILNCIETHRDFCRFGAKQKRYLMQRTYDSINGLDLLQELLRDDEITEIMINGKDHIFIEKKGKIIKCKERFSTQQRLEQIIQKIVSDINRRVNETHPIVDARLEDGSRVHIVLPPVSLCGPIVTIRRFSKNRIHMNDLIANGSITREAAMILELLVKAKYNIFISGGTGSGKTTLLNVLTDAIPRDERIITIEDSAELQIVGVENLVRLESRQANAEGENEVSMRDLIRAALRMRPDRLIVGEVRGEEAIDMLQAMNTGHDGSLSTGHGNSPLDMLRRIETMVVLGVDLPLDAIRGQIASGIDILVHIGRMRDKSRKVLEIIEIENYAEGSFYLNPLFLFEESSTEERKVCGQLKYTGNSIVNRKKLEMFGLVKELEKVCKGI